MQEVVDQASGIARSDDLVLLSRLLADGANLVAEADALKRAHRLAIHADSPRQHFPLHQDLV